MRRAVSLFLALCGAAAALLALAGSASAHVTVSAPDAVQGGDTVVTFQVPTESETASTTGVTVQLPTATPIASVLDQPQPGWTFHATTSKLDTPIQTDDGPVSQAVTEVQWTAAAGGGIKPGQFDQFVLSMGPLPKVDSITFKVIQAYSDGTKVSWIDVPAPGSTAEPEHPAPVLALAPAESPSGSSAAASSAASAGGTSSAAAAAPKNASQTGPVVLGVVALVVAAVAVVTAALALARSRRQVGDHT